MSVAFFNILPKGKPKGDPKPFIIKMDTTLGDGLNQIRLPIQGAQPMVIDWGDGNIETVTQTASPASTNWVTHSYANSGIYDIKVSETLQAIRFDNSGDVLKPIEVVQWGDCVWTTFARAFNSCANISFPNLPIPNLGAVTEFGRAFRNIGMTAMPFRFLENANPQSLLFAFYLNNLTSLNANDVAGMRVATDFREVFRSNNLQTVEAGIFDTFVATDWLNCFQTNQLNQQSVDNILISINTARLGGFQGAGSKRIGIYGGTNATPSQAGKDATDALRAAGFTVTLNGY